MAYCPIAAFDFDGTLAHGDSLIPFLYLLHGPLKTTGHLLACGLEGVRFLCGLSSRQECKEMLLTRCLANMPYSTLVAHARLYAETRLDRFLKPKAMERVFWHQRQGHRCILVSASLECYLQPWGERHGFETVLASRLELTQGGVITGKLAGLNCWGVEKVRRLIRYLGPPPHGVLYAYGDSQGDHPLLAIADHAFYRAY